MNNELNELMNDDENVSEVQESSSLSSSGRINASELQSESELANQLDDEIAQDTEEPEAEVEEIEEVEEEEQPEKEEEVEEVEKPVRVDKKETSNVRQMREALRKKDEELRKYREVDVKRQQTEFDKMTDAEKIPFLQRVIYNQQQTSQQTNAKKTEDEVEKQLLQEFPDLYEVLTPENVAELRGKNRYFADMTDNTSNSPGELYNKAVSGYMLMRKHGIYKKDNFAKQKKSIKNNFKKPLPSNAARSSSSSEGLSEFSDFMGKTAQEKKAYINKKSLMYAQGYDE